MKVMIADDHAVVRSGLRFIIEAQEDMDVVGDAADGTEIFQLLEQQIADVVLMDLRMPPGENGLQTTARIKEYFADVKVIVLTMHHDEGYVEQALQAGAKGYVLKNSQDHVLLDCIRAVYAGDLFIDPAFGYSEERIREAMLSEDNHLNRIDRLSKREKELLPFVARGYGNKEIAEQLFVSVKTVEVHKANIMKKLEVDSYAELLHYCVRQNLVDL